MQQSILLAPQTPLLILNKFNKNWTNLVRQSNNRETVIERRFKSKKETEAIPVSKRGRELPTLPTREMRDPIIKDL